MCDLNGKFILCSCSEEVDLSEPHWKLYRNSMDNGEYHRVIIGMMTPLNLIEKIERRKLLRRLNSQNVFDFEYQPKENDVLELFPSEYDEYKLTFIKGKWVLEEFMGEHLVFEHQDISYGKIEGEESELKRVYRKYKSTLKIGEHDIVDCGWMNMNERMSEKELIEKLKKSST